MIFQNFEVFPLGNAQLSITPEGHLLVSNIGNSGVDGVMINVLGHSDYKVHFSQIPSILQGGVLQIITIGRNQLNQSAPTSEEVYWYEPRTNLVQFGYNMGLMPRYFTLFGELDGNRVFEIPKENPLFSGAKAIWPIVAAIASVVAAVAGVYSALKTTHHKRIIREYWPNGNIKREDITEITDPQQFEIIVDGQSFLVDQWGIQYEYNFPEENDVKTYDNSAIQIVGYNLGSFEIISII
ncbi:hypothetical protein D9V84_11050 [Bacteroidetes/Chlorobi group bacterium Naka2016]|jgi:hypothetical protein|nr:MAG: hypothetical protein D9V84_11050 [Bacteroidetes/Chlorobi group bacterium Naka2016]